ncbi:MAG TPA: AI-2E family transporter [Phycisphaerales bacterium]|nr:AI-2E family transporter [Phycisphaerales bacterium]
MAKEPLLKGDASSVPAAARLHIWQFQAVRDALFILTCIGLVWLGYAMRTVTVPLLVALLLAYLFEPLVARLSAHPKLSRPVVVGGLMGTVGIIVGIVLLVVVTVIVSQTGRLITEIREGRFEQRAVAIKQFVPENHRGWVDDLYRSIFGAPDDDSLFDDEQSDAAANGERAEPDPEIVVVDADAAALTEPTILDEAKLRKLIREEANELLAERERAAETGGVIDWWGVLQGGAGTVLGLVGATIAFSFMLFLIPFYFFFFSVGFPHVVEFGRSLIPEASRPRTLELLGKMDRVIAGFVRGRIIVSLLMGIGFAIGWWWIGVPYAILLGFVIGLFCAVPFLGIIGVPLAVGLLFYGQFDPVTGLGMAWWKIILYPTLVFVIVQTIESYALTPMIAGKATNLDPVTIIVAVLAGGSIMGVYGMLLAIPVAACLKILITDVLLPRIRAWTRGEVKDPLPISAE